MLDKDNLGNQISVGVTFASLMAAISLFFTGILVSEYSSLGPTIKVPMLFLIVSTFSFIFAATIYSNAGSEIVLGKFKTVEKYLVYAANIVEFLGLYPLIISMPLVIGAITEDSFLRTTTTIVAVVGMALYSQSKFSILEKQLPSYQKIGYSFTIVLLTLLLYVSQVIQQSFGTSYYSLTAIALLLLLLAPTIYFSIRSKQYRVVTVRPYKTGDALALANIAKKNLKLSKRSLKAKLAAELLKGNDTEDDLQRRGETQQLLVAVVGSARVGYVAYEGDTIHIVLTDLHIQRKGVGRMLVGAAESAIAEAGYEEISAITRAPSDKFFKKLGFVYESKDKAGLITLKKEL